MQDKNRFFLTFFFISFWFNFFRKIYFIIHGALFYEKRRLYANNSAAFTLFERSKRVLSFGIQLKALLQCQPLTPQKHGRMTKMTKIIRLLFQTIGYDKGFSQLPSDLLCKSCQRLWIVLVFKVSLSIDLVVLFTLYDLREVTFVFRAELNIYSYAFKTRFEYFAKAVLFFVKFNCLNSFIIFLVIYISISCPTLFCTFSKCTFSKLVIRSNLFIKNNITFI